MRVNTPVRIINVPVKIGWDGEALVAEVHPLLESPQPLVEESLEHIEQLDADVELPEPDPNSKDPLTLCHRAVHCRDVRTRRAA